MTGNGVLRKREEGRVGKRMTFWGGFVVALFLFNAPAFAQSGVSDPDRAAFLQGQLETEQAHSVGNMLAASCGGYASIINSHYYRPTLIIPVECDEFWTFVEVFGPRFWYVREYPRVQASLGGFYDRGAFHSYGLTLDERDNRERFRRAPRHDRGENHAIINVRGVRRF
jgi:hypothetical protein